MTQRQQNEDLLLYYQDKARRLRSEAHAMNQAAKTAQNSDSRERFNLLCQNLHFEASQVEAACARLLASTSEPSSVAA